MKKRRRLEIFLRSFANACWLTLLCLVLLTVWSMGLGLSSAVFFSLVWRVVVVFGGCV